MYMCMYNDTRLVYLNVVGWAKNNYVPVCVFVVRNQPAVELIDETQRTILRNKLRNIM